MNRNIGLTLTGLGFYALLTLGCSDDPPTRAQGNQGPTPPTRLTARFVTATQIRLDWQDNALGEDGFEIFEAVAIDSNFINIGTSPANSENAYLEGKNSALKYFYKIRAYSSDGNSGFSNKFELEGGSMLARLELEEGTMRCAAFNPDGSKVATGSGDYKVRLWDWATESEIRTFLYHERAVTRSQFSPGGGRLVTTDDIQVVVWDVNAGQYNYSFVGTRPQYSPDGRFLLAVVDTTVTLFDPTTYNPLHVLARTDTELFFSSDGRWLITGGAPIRKYDLNGVADTLRAVQTMNRYVDSTDINPRIPVLEGRLNAITPDAQFAIVGSLMIRMSDSTVVRVMDNFGGSCFAMSPDGTMLAAGTTDWKILLWDVATGQQTRVLHGHTYSVYSVAWNAASSYVVSASGDGSARIWGPFNRSL